MRNDDQTPPTPADNAAALFRLLAFAARCVGYPMELMTRRVGSMGVGYPGPAVALGGVVAVPLLAVVVAPPHYGVGWVGLYPLVLIGLAVVHGVAKRARRGHVHTQFIGTPWFGGERRRDGETLLGGVIAVGSFLVSDTLGWLHLAAVVCARLTFDLIVERDKRILRRMKDAEIEGRYYADRLRGGR